MAQNQSTDPLQISFKEGDAFYDEFVEPKTSRARKTGERLALLKKEKDARSH